MRVAVLGAGAVGARLARQLVSTEQVSEVVLRDPNRSRLEDVARSLGEGAIADQSGLLEPLDAEVVVLAGDPGAHDVLAARFLRADQHVVSVSDDLRDVRALLELDSEARERGRAVVVGAGFAPGLTCVLAAHGARRFDAVDEVHVAKVGTGGPACARQHHRALGRMALDWREGGWVQRPPMSGRELSWFPDPVGAQDCYRAALPDALLLVPAFPGVQRVTSRVAATRRDRLTARLPMLWPTHPEGGPGAVRVEIRGRRGRAREVVVFGAMDRPAVAAGAVAAVAAWWAAEGRLARHGAAGLAELAEPLPFLLELGRRGVRAAVFEGDAP
ncbi:saccharopine dehydrogenase family protein [Rhabdothermincola sediminis]|uniref:saccharopine dehydrogenase family protein n=1 Tax=Rhabdothermincola sediminis TaxID=2751370 RepID=UPI001AA0950A|nr:NAD(P)-binding domain-containing protein [Rhabdothermincola sediminis]